MKKQGLIIDTNLLLLLVIGALADGQYISSSKRLNQYIIEDYDIVASLIAEFEQVYITPYIAAEVSNLIDLHGAVNTKAFEIARELFTIFEELNTEISEDVADKEFLQYGLADASLVKLAKEYCILTADEKLSSYIYSINQDNVIPYYLVKQGI